MQIQTKNNETSVELFYSTAKRKGIGNRQPGYHDRYTVIIIPVKGANCVFFNRHECTKSCLY